VSDAVGRPATSASSDERHAETCAETRDGAPAQTPTGPPRRLDAPLELDPGTWAGRDVYRLLTALVVPRPIAWVSTRSTDGVDNVAPHSFFTVVSSAPPHVAFSSTGEKDTLRNVRATGAFVVNVVHAELLEAMNLTAADLPPDEDEFAWAGLEAAPAHRVDAPRVAAARAHLECELRQEVEVGSGRLVIGEVVHVHVVPEVWHDGRVDVAALDPVARLAGGGYARLADHVTLPRPTWDQLRDR
jgi:flavin reductase (DIM6/NTAB) family NADH-FMN oxidoreductase RutF